MSHQQKWFQSKETADVYAKHRPTYGSEVYEAIVSFCRETEACDFSLALDVGCGSGQSSVPLTKHFKRVIGLDVSQAQVDRTPKDIPNLSFRVGPAEDLSFLEDGSVDLVTVATALHWLDEEKFFPEVERVLKPGGAFVPYAIGLPSFDDPRAQEIHDHFFLDVLKPYWTEAIPALLCRYQSVVLSFPNWRRDDSLTTEDTWALENFVGYLRSTSSSQRYHLANPASTALDTVRQREWDGKAARERSGHRPHSAGPREVKSLTLRSPTTRWLLTEVYQSNGGDTAKEKIRVLWSVIMLKGHKPLQS